MTETVQLERHKVGHDHPIIPRFLNMLQEWDEITMLPGWCKISVHGDGQQQSFI